MPMKTIKKINIFALSAIMLTMLCSWHSPLVQLQYQTRDCRIDSIKSNGEWNFIYASDSCGVYRIISGNRGIYPVHDPMSDSLCSEKLIVGNRYRLSLGPLFEHERKVSGEVAASPKAGWRTYYPDGITNLHKEYRPRELHMYYYCSNINGTDYIEGLLHKDKVANRSGLYDGVYCDSSAKRIIEIRDSTAYCYTIDTVPPKYPWDFGYYLKNDSTIVESSWKLGYYLENEAAVIKTSQNKYSLRPRRTTIFNDCNIVYWPEKRSDSLFVLISSYRYEEPYSATLYCAYMENGRVRTSAIPAASKKSRFSYDSLGGYCDIRFTLPAYVSVFSFTITFDTDAGLVTYVYPGVIRPESEPLWIDLPAVNPYSVRMPLHDSLKFVPTYRYIDVDGTRYYNYEVYRSMFSDKIHPRIPPLFNSSLISRLELQGKVIESGN